MSKRFRLKAGGTLAAWTIALVVASTTAAADAQTSPRVVNGLLTSDFPTTGALLRGTTADDASAWCSGTLIGCNTFLTAGHCVEGDLAPSHYQVFLQHGGIFAVSSISLNPAYNFPVADVAVLKLQTAVSGIRPTALNTVQDPPFGSAGVIVGFGRSGGSNDDYGIKRYGAVTTGSCSAAGESDTTSVCWTFSAPLGSPGSNSNTCNADSGGPLFLTLGGNSVVAGITSGGTLDSCLTGDASYDADVYYYRSFIQSVGGSDIGSTSCGAIPQVGDGQTEVTAFAGTVNSGSPDATHAFTVPPGIEELRVAMNGVDDGSDFDLYVKRGSPPTTSSYDCGRIGSNQYGVCSFANPGADTWYAMVHLYNGSGQYQLTVTKFGGGCSDPANNGLPCDDDNPCTSGDICGGGTCQGAVADNGTACGSGTLCSGPATCQEGACTTNPTPAVGCKQTVDPTDATITIKDSSSDNGDKIQWKWRGQQTLNFGTPTTTTNYALCVYDQASGARRLVVDASIPAGLRWQSTSSGYKYSDSSGASSGVRAAKLRYGEDRRASINVVARGANTTLPPLALDQDTEVLVQLVTDAGLCWEAHYGTNKTNSTTLFRAKSN